jgi:NAD-dependent SIR2 family protein deacetylase
VRELKNFIEGRRLFVLTGAGVSTDSGIPDYRGPATRHRARRPVQHRDFVTEPKARVRYWARSTLGWPRFRAFEPNASHRALARLEAQGVVTALVTQNVDRLHTKAGHRGVLELHGSLHLVRCLSCGSTSSRDGLQARLLQANPSASSWSYELAPDGDAELPDAALEAFAVPGCLKCGGVLKPDVVFFGDNVPPRRVQAAFTQLRACDAMLVVGSSLHVWSGYRFVLAAAEANMPIAIVNLGETRGDAHASLRVDGRAAEVLEGLLQTAQRPDPAGLP